MIPVASKNGTARGRASLREGRKSCSLGEGSEKAPGKKASRSTRVIARSSPRKGLEAGEGSRGKTTKPASQTPRI